MSSTETPATSRSTANELSEPTTLVSTPASTPATITKPTETTPTTKPAITAPTKIAEPPPRKPTGPVTVYVADTRSLRGKHEMWKTIFRGIADDPVLTKAFGVPLVRLVDRDGARSWDGLSDWPPARSAFENEDWNAILKALGRASAVSDCAPRVLWLMENSSFPDNLNDQDKLKSIEELLPPEIERKRVTLIWSGHGTPSNALLERFPAGRKAPNRRLITLKDIVVTLESFAKTLKVELRSELEADLNR